MKCLTKTRSTKDGKTQARCAECREVKALPHYDWTELRVGGDASCLVCPECSAKALERTTTGYENGSER